MVDGRKVFIVADTLDELLLDLLDEVRDPEQAWEESERGRLQIRRMKDGKWRAQWQGMKLTPPDNL